MKQSEPGFKRTINWNKYQSKVTDQAQSKNLVFLIDSSFQGVNRLFVLSFKDRDVRKSYKQYFFPTVETKVYNVMMEETSLINQ